MGDDISAMLSEAQLPPSLWGEALATQIQVWNRLSTFPLKGMTPYKAWFKRIPNVSHLIVWGCLAYVFIQKEQCSLQPHMEKCVFMGYPSGYKGWKFYNPTTQKYLISERAEFDERIFPGLAKYKATSQTDLTPPGSLPLVPVPTSVPMFDLEGDSDVEVIAPHIPHAELPLDVALPERTPTPPALPAIVHAPLPAPAQDPPPDLHHTSRISCSTSDSRLVEHILMYITASYFGLQVFSLSHKQKPSSVWLHNRSAVRPSTIKLV